MKKTILAAAMILFACPLHAADDYIINQPGQAAPGLRFAPGAVVLLPDGRRTIIEEALPDGQWRTDLGIVLNQDGALVTDPDEKAVLLDPVTMQPEKQEETAKPKTPEKTALPETAQPVKPEAVKIAEPETGTPKEAVAAGTPEKKQPETGIKKRAQQEPDMKKEEHLTLAQMLPTTRVPEAAEKTAREEKKAPAAAEQPQNASKPETAKKQEQKSPQQKKEEKKPVPARKNDPKTQKAKPGQELRIPPEAAATGNLDFLEGCWQGTRPEYYSKRTIRECFCFGANGKNGKRRVYDPKGGRMCIGASRASLSSGGVLSVTSEGAACTDGERWGQAEMVCKNSGPRTPCSWVFRDANNGHQSYEIPFVRVESCGR